MAKKHKAKKIYKVLGRSRWTAPEKHWIDNKPRVCTYPVGTYVKTEETEAHLLRLPKDVEEVKAFEQALSAQKYEEYDTLDYRGDKHTHLRVKVKEEVKEEVKKKLV